MRQEIGSHARPRPAVRALPMCAEMRTAALLLFLALTGCAGWTAPSCPAGLKPAQIAKLYFGRNIGAKDGVGDAAWTDFVAREIAPRFADGFTIADASGGWRDATGATIRERSKVVTIVLPEDAAAQTRLAAIRRAYRARFAQDSVLLVESRACAGF